MQRNFFLFEKVILLIREVATGLQGKGGVSLFFLILCFIPAVVASSVEVCFREKSARVIFGKTGKEVGG